MLVATECRRYNCIPRYTFYRSRGALFGVPAPYLGEMTPYVGTLCRVPHCGPGDLCIYPLGRRCKFEKLLNNLSFFATNHTIFFRRFKEDDNSFLKPIWMWALGRLSLCGKIKCCQIIQWLAEVDSYHWKVLTRFLQLWHLISSCHLSRWLNSSSYLYENKKMSW